MINAKLFAATRTIDGQVESEFLAIASHAAKKCYQAESPKLGEMIDVEGRLFRTSHHTTLEHYSFTWDIEGIAVSDITLGAHLASPFYNSDQRSGRFCAKMFENPDFSSIREYVKFFWPKIGALKRQEVMDFVKTGVEVYHQQIGAATKIAADLIAEERPKASVKYIEANAPKIAQEQLRMFISAIFPTGFDLTLDHIALASLYKAAWTPGLMFLTQQMADSVLTLYPEIAYMFSRRGKIWSPIFAFSGQDYEIKYKPGCILRAIDDSDGVVWIPEPEDMYPLDLLHFLPETMNNGIGGVKTKVEISMACMGQDQRHRTIRRGEPVFTGNFYLPPIPALLPKAAVLVKEVMDKWLKIVRPGPWDLAATVAPYGAMMRYVKNASFNALFHEQNKRLCWCAQEEIYHVGRSLRQAIEKERGKDSPLLRVLEPYCFKTGKCAEGDRYCGRDIGARKTGEYFPARRI
ncbi:FAD-dependent thymidylate synthase [Patescibacteria group bacterium]|nr:FAD-dependent thymidylate synthase [Patescibacteria group bacterium]